MYLVFEYFFDKYLMYLRVRMPVSAAMLVISSSHLEQNEFFFH